MDDLKKRLGNAAILAGQMTRKGTNAPSEYGGKREAYYAAETSAFRSRIAKYASDVYRARVQGLNPDDFFAWCVRDIRMADIVNPSASIQKQMDNVKNIMFTDGGIEYLPRGAKIEAAGNTWLVTNPQNISSVGASGIVERCRAVWNFLDWYGNVCSEPLVVNDDMIRANAQDPQEITLVTKGYLNVKCQYNEATRQLDTNSRMILGSGAYHVTGYSDFMQEFTGDYDSVRMLEFTLRYEDPIYEIDDMERHVAGGKNFRWAIDVSGNSSMKAGARQALMVQSVRNGERVESSYEHPIYYHFSSSDESVATVDQKGVVTAKMAGSCEITVWVEQNPDLQSVFRLFVAESESAEVAFLSCIPDFLNAYDSVTLEAAYFENGEKSEAMLEWELGGAEEGSWSYLVDGNRVTIDCWSASVTPLMVKARYGDHSATADIKLRGI